MKYGCAILQKSSLRASEVSLLARWYADDFGRRFALSEHEILDHVLSTMFGYHAVCISCPIVSGDWLAASRISHRCLLHPVEGCGQDSSLVADPCAMPFGPDSVDVFVVVHMHECLDYVPPLFHEIERCLIPEGCLLLLGFNPLAEGGLWRLLGGRSGNLSSGLRLHGAAAASMDIKRAGLDVERVFFHGRKSEWWRQLACWPVALGAKGYLLVAKKRLSTFTPVRPRWRSRRLAAVGVVGAPRIGYGGIVGEGQEYMKMRGAEV